jgi:opacity protein-like surface antigen
MVSGLPLITALASSPAPARDVDRPPPRAVDPTIPSAARGFQAALRSGVQLPWGDASDLQGDELAARYGWQVPLLLDAGFKLRKPVFLGLYAGMGYGLVGDGNEAEAACRAPGASCNVLSYQLGVQGQYHFGPSDRLNPWLGVGFGYEMVRQSLSSGTYSETQRSSGVTLLKLSFGIDYRSSFGFGPFVEASAGRYEATRTEVGGSRVHEGPVDPSAWHGFLTIGARLVVLP